MPRDLTAAMLAELDIAQVRPALFVELAYANETIFMWSGLGTFTPPGPATDVASSFPYGQAWLGLGYLGQISAIPTTTDVIAQSVTLKLSGVPAELITDTITAVRLNSIATCWLGFFDKNNNLIGDPTQLFQGHADVPTITDSAETCDISITFENALIGLNLASQRLFTDVDQQLDFPGDTGFAFVNAMQNLFIPFPATVVAIANNTGPTGPASSTGISLSPSGPSAIALFGTLSVTAIATFVGGGTANVTSAGFWTSSDPLIATVSNGTGASGGTGGSGGGVVTANARGVCTVTFYYGQVSASLTIEIGV